MDTQQDTPLFLKFRETGDAAALETVLKRHLNTMYTVALRILNNANDAEDTVQNATIRIMRAADKFNAAYPLKPWLLQKTADAARDYRRKQVSTVRKEKAKSMESETVLTEDPLRHMEREDLEAALSELDEELQLPIILYYYDKMTQQQIGDVVGCSHQTVQKRLVRAMEKLRFRLGALGLAVTAASVTSLLGSSQVQAAPLTLSSAIGPTIAANMSTAAIGIASAGASTAATATSAVAGTQGILLTTGAVILSFIVGTQTPAIIGSATDTVTRQEFQEVESENIRLHISNNRINKEMAEQYRLTGPPLDTDTDADTQGLQQLLSQKDNTIEGLRSELKKTRKEYAGWKLGAKMLASSVGSNDETPEPPKTDYSELEAAIERDIHDRHAIAAYRKALTDNRDFKYGVRFYTDLMAEHANASILQAERGGLQVAEFGNWTEINQRLKRTDIPSDEKLRMGITVYEGLLSLNEALLDDADNRWALLIRARFAHALGQKDVAKEDLLHLDSLYTTSPTEEDDSRRVLMLLVSMYADQGDLQTAAMYWNRGSELYHNDDEFFALQEKYNYFREE